MWLSVILLLSVHSSGILAVSPAIPENDIQLIKNISSCAKRNCAAGSKTPIEPTCRCDEDCKIYADCCYDSPLLDLQEQFDHREDIECVWVEEEVGVYMRASCPNHWQGTYVSNACKAPPADDLLLLLPATSTRTSITYKNSYCAACHQETDLKIWKAAFAFPDDLDTSLELTKDIILNSKFQYRSESKQWEITIENATYPINVDASVPDEIKPVLKKCPLNLVQNCNSSGWGEVEGLCQSYRYVVYDSTGRGYKNPHCAQCNNIPWTDINCELLVDRDHFLDNMPPLSIIVDWNEVVPGKTSQCNSAELYDVTSKKCRKVKRDLQGFLSLEKQEKPLLGRHMNAGIRTSTCLQFLKHEYIRVDDVIFVPNHNRTYPLNDTVYEADETIVICSNHTVDAGLVEKFGFVGKAITFVGFIISIIFILLHLLFYFISKQKSRLPKKNVACLSVSLLFSYASLMVGKAVKDYCYASSVITCYTLLASFTWMLIISYDVWRTIRSATSYRRAFQGVQWLRFAGYSALAWGAPLLVAASAVLSDASAQFPEEWKPHFGVNSCWFGQRNGLVVFFILPFALTMSLNSIFFFLASLTVYRADAESPSSFDPKIKKKYKLFFRLALTMGLTWTTGIIASTFDNIILWYGFIALNSLQGLYIFIAFTWTHSSMKEVKSAFYNRVSSKMKASMQSTTSSTLP